MKQECDTEHLVMYNRTLVERIKMAISARIPLSVDEIGRCTVRKVVAENLCDAGDGRVIFSLTATLSGNPQFTSLTEVLFFILARRRNVPGSH